jgi:beta-lactam-binding protein with PASTA domain
MVLLKKIGNYLWSKQFLLNFAAIVLVYFLGIWLFKCSLESRTHLGEKIEVPNLIGKNQNNLENIFANSDLKYEVLDSIYDPSKVEGTILEQDPSPTALTDVSVKAGRVIKIRVSKRTQLVEMPGLVDKSQRFAENILLNRGFRYSLEYKPSREAHGAVLQQLFNGKPIVKGAKIPIGSRIKLIVGRDEGGSALALPNLYGLTIVEAKKRVKNMGNMEFDVVCPTCITSADSIIARVQTQSPEFSEEAVVASGTTITVIASKDFEEAPQ